MYVHYNDSLVYIVQIVIWICCEGKYISQGLLV